jgi:hypothetical protein
MADEPNPDTDDELLLTDEVQDDEADQAGDDEQQQDNDEQDAEEDVLTFGDDGEPQDGDTNLVKHLREQIKQRDKDMAELRKSARQPEAVEVGEKPTLAGCDYDEDKFEAELDAWKERKRAVDSQKSAGQEAEEAEREAWQAELNRYNDGKAKLGFADTAEVEETVKASLNTVQQAVILKAADDPARLIYALGRHPDRLTELAAITDPLKLAAKVAKLEGTLRVVKKRRAPEPDRAERGSGSVSTQKKDARLEKLEKDAETTGDRTELIAYRKKQAAAKK